MPSLVWKIWYISTNVFSEAIGKFMVLLLNFFPPYHSFPARNNSETLVGLLFTTSSKGHIWKLTQEVNVQVLDKSRVFMPTAGKPCGSEGGHSWTLPQVHCHCCVPEKWSNRPLGLSQEACWCSMIKRIVLIWLWNTKINSPALLEIQQSSLVPFCLKRRKNTSCFHTAKLPGLILTYLFTCFNTFFYRFLQVTSTFSPETRWFQLACWNYLFSQGSDNWNQVNLDCLLSSLWYIGALLD